MGVGIVTSLEGFREGDASAVSRGGPGPRRSPALLGTYRSSSSSRATLTGCLLSTSAPCSRGRRCHPTPGLSQTPLDHLRTNAPDLRVRCVHHLVPPVCERVYSHNAKPRYLTPT